MLAYLITEPELATAGPLDPTLEVPDHDEPLLAALAYEAAPDIEDGRWIPVRRRPTVGVAVPLA